MTHEEFYKEKYPILKEAEENLNMLINQFEKNETEKNWEKFKKNYFVL